MVIIIIALIPLIVGFKLIAFFDVFVCLNESPNCLYRFSSNFFFFVVLCFNNGYINYNTCLII